MRTEVGGLIITRGSHRMGIHISFICLFFHKEELALVPALEGSIAFFLTRFPGTIDSGKVASFPSPRPKSLSCMSSVILPWRLEPLFQRSVSGGFSGRLHLLSFIFEALGFMNYRPRLFPAGIEMFDLIWLRNDPRNVNWPFPGNPHNTKMTRAKVSPKRQLKNKNMCLLENLMFPQLILPGLLFESFLPQAWLFWWVCWLLALSNMVRQFFHVRL